MGRLRSRPRRRLRVRIAPGDLLVLYSDGITEAQDSRQEFFEEDRLIEVVGANVGRAARDIQDAILAEVNGFMGDAPQFDDITLFVVARD